MENLAVNAPRSSGTRRRNCHVQVANQLTDAIIVRTIPRKPLGLAFYGFRVYNRRCDWPILGAGLSRNAHGHYERC